MKSIHRRVFPFLLLTALWSAGAGAQVTDRKIEVQPLSGSVYRLKGKGISNIVVSAGDDGILMVDDQEGPTANDILAALKTITNQPLRFVVNTHVHADHTGGNDVFGKMAPIIAHRNVRMRMMNGPDKRPEEAWPTITFEGEVNLYFNGEDIRILGLPAGHTDGDCVVFFAKANVVHMGDIFMTKGASFGEPSNGGSYAGLIASLEYVLPQIPVDAKVIPGHGTIFSRADVVRGLEALKEMKAIVEAGIAAGKTKEQMIAEKPFENWKDSIAWFRSTDAYVADLYKELSRK